METKTIPTAKKVGKFSMSGTRIAVYPSLRNCAKCNKIAVTTLFKAIRDKKFINGCFYRYTI